MIMQMNNSIGRQCLVSSSNKKSLGFNGKISLGQPLGAHITIDTSVQEHS